MYCIEESICDIVDSSAPSAVIRHRHSDSAPWEFCPSLRPCIASLLPADQYLKHIFVFKQSLLPYVVE